jgi:hypothetical membrane protein
MNTEDWKVKAYILEIFGCIQYIILIFVAMLFYAGGTGDNPNIKGYSFWKNSLSDLGRTVAYSGQTNIISMIIFTITLSLWGFSLIPFFSVLPNYANEDSIDKKLSYIGSFFGVLSGICLMGIAFTPDDILDGPHMIFVYIGYTSLVLTGLFYSITFYRNDNIPRIYAYLFAIFAIVQFITSIFGLIGLGSSGTLLATSQKIGRYTVVIFSALIGYGLWKMENQ